MLLSWCSVLRVWMGWMQSFSLWVLEAVFWAGALNGVGSIRPSLARNVLQPSKQKRKFSSFFKSLVIELDKELYGPDNHLVEVRCAWLHPRKSEESCAMGSDPAAHPAGAQIPNPAPARLAACFRVERELYSAKQC